MIDSHRKLFLKAATKAASASVRSFCCVTIDARNTHLLRAYIKTYGFPCRCRIGPVGIEAVWEIAQHSDHDVVFQRECLAQMKFCHCRVPRHYLIYLEDRIAVNSSSPQNYGTQFHGHGRSLVEHPISNRRTLWWRRLRVGMMPFILSRYLMRRRSKTL
jgi:hypothetical protein